MPAGHVAALYELPMDSNDQIKTRVDNIGPHTMDLML